MQTAESSDRLSVATPVATVVPLASAESLEVLQATPVTSDNEVTVDLGLEVVAFERQANDDASESEEEQEKGWFSLYPRKTFNTLRSCVK